LTFSLKSIIPLLFVLLWSTGFIGTKYGLDYASSSDFLTLRTLGNIIVFAIFLLFVKKKSLNNIEIFHAMITGLLIHGAYLGGVFAAIEFGIPAGLTAIIVGLQPLFTAMVAIFLFKESIKKSQWLALNFGLLGLVLVVSASLELSGVSILALGFAFIALLGITFGTLYQKRFCQKQPMLPSVLWQYIASLLLFAPISIFQNTAPIQWELPFILSLVWLIFGLSVAAILLLMYMVKHGDATKVTAYFYLVPPMTAIEAFVLFDETLSLTSMFGMVLCALSVFVIIKAKASDKSEETSQ